MEKELYGVLLSEIKKDGDEVLSRRPERKLIVDAKGEFIKYGKSALYNQCWYTERFCMMGNDNLKYSIPHKELYAAMRSESESSKRLREFVLGKQQLLIRSAGSKFDITDFKKSEAEFVSLVPNVNARLLSYGQEKVVYEIETPVALKVVENELWWPGWKVGFCKTERHCQPLKDTNRTKEYLRQWDVQEGKWRLELTFEPNKVL